MAYKIPFCHGKVIRPQSTISGKARQEIIRVTDRVVAREWDCPICHSRVWFKVVMEEREETGNMPGIKKVIENPFEIRVQTEDDRVIVLRKEKPEMVLTAE